MEKTVTLPRLLSQRELVAYLGKSEAWAERSRWDGSGPVFCRIGRHIRYRAEDVEQWINAGRRKSTSDRGAA